MRKNRICPCLFFAFLFLFETGLAETGDRYRERINTPLRDRDAIVTCEHVWGEWTEVTPASEEADGAKECVCSVCGKTRWEIIPRETEEVGIPADFVPDDTWLIWRVTDENGNQTEKWAHPSRNGLYKTSVVLPDGSFAEAYTADLYPVSDTVPEEDRVGFVYNKQKTNAYNVFREGCVYETSLDNYVPGGTIIFILEEMPQHVKVLYGNRVVYIGKRSVYFICCPKDREPDRIRIQDPVYPQNETRLQYDTLKDGGYTEILGQETVLNLYGYEKSFIVTEYNGTAGFVPMDMVNFCVEKPETVLKVRLYRDRTMIYHQPADGEISDRTREKGEYEVEDLFITKDGTEYYLITVNERKGFVKAGDVELVPAGAGPAEEAADAETDGGDAAE